MQSYDALSAVYDLFADDFDHAKWAEYYRALLRRAGVEANSLVDAGCGTGRMTVELAREGARVVGVDISEGMLRVAAERLRREGVRAMLAHEDMCRLSVPRPVDAVICACDGVNYLLDDVDVLEFFSSAYQALRPGGGLFFDISTPHKLRDVLGNQIICEDLPKITYFWQNSFNDKTKVLDMHLCFFVKQEDGTYKRIDETQRQKAHTLRHLSDLLYQSGFDRVTVFGDGRLEAPRESERRWHFAAIRRADPTNMA